MMIIIFKAKLYLVINFDHNYLNLIINYATHFVNFVGMELLKIIHSKFFMQHYLIVILKNINTLLE